MFRKIVYGSWKSELVKHLRKRLYFKDRSRNYYNKFLEYNQKVKDEERIIKDLEDNAKGNKKPK